MCFNHRHRTFAGISGKDSMMTISAVNNPHVIAEAFIYPYPITGLLLGIHLERAFASMTCPPVKSHIIFCHACPNPASLLSLTYTNYWNEHSTAEVQGAAVTYHVPSWAAP